MSYEPSCKVVTHTELAGVAAVVVTCGRYELTVATTVGPRVLGLRLDDGPQMFASLPGLTIERPGASPFSFYGGHRLWVAPEVAAVTYAPDDNAVDVAIGDGSVTIAAAADGAGWDKTISIAPAADGLIVDHTLRNTRSDRSVAAWAITQLATGGTAILPLGAQPTDPVQPDRSLVLWPYTHWDDPLLRVSDAFVEVVATRQDPLKVGTALRRGWLAYRHDDQLFVKRAAHPEGRPLADLGATGQCYCNDAFLELESVGPLQTVTHGAALHHREIWQIHAVDAAAALPDIAFELGLDTPHQHLGHS